MENDKTTKKRKVKPADRANETIGRVFDPSCGSSGMFVQSVELIRAHGGAVRPKTNRWPARRT